MCPVRSDQCLPPTTLRCSSVLYLCNWTMSNWTWSGGTGFLTLNGQKGSLTSEPVCASQSANDSHCLKFSFRLSNNSELNMSMSRPGNNTDLLLWSFTGQTGWWEHASVPIVSDTDFRLIITGKYKSYVNTLQTQMEARVRKIVYQNFSCTITPEEAIPIGLISSSARPSTSSVITSTARVPEVSMLATALSSAVSHMTENHTHPTDSDNSAPVLSNTGTEPGQAVTIISVAVVVAVAAVGIIISIIVIRRRRSSRRRGRSREDVFSQARTDASTSQEVTSPDPVYENGSVDSTRSCTATKETCEAEDEYEIPVGWSSAADNVYEVPETTTAATTERVGVETEDRRNTGDTSFSTVKGATPGEKKAEMKTGHVCYARVHIADQGPDQHVYTDLKQ